MAIKLSFRDNSEHESGFHVYRSDAPMDPRNLPKPYKDLGRNSSVVIDEDFGGIFDQRRYYRVAAYVKGGNRSVSEEAHAGYDGKSPTLKLDFASLQYAVAQGIGLDLSPRAFSDLITFTRSTGGGRFNAQGQYEWLPADTPRIDYDPVTGECRGLLIEEQRTNLLTYSSDFGNAAWTNLGAGLSVVAGTASAPDGSATASKLVETTGTGTHQVRQRVNPLAKSAPYTFSIFLKAGERVKASVLLGNSALNPDRTVLIDLTTGVLGFSSGVVATSNDAGNGWWRLTVTKVSAASGTDADFVIRVADDTGATSYQGDGTSGIYIWGAQLEAGSFPTSHIPTTTAQVTRAADIATVNELSPWFNPEAGTLFVEAVSFAAVVSGSVASFYAALQSGGSGIISMYRSNLPPGRAGMYIVKDGTQVIDAQGWTLPQNGVVSRSAVAFGGGRIQMATDGALGLFSDTDAPTVSQLIIGGRAGANRALNGHIRSIRYHPKRLSDTELQALTA